VFSPVSSTQSETIVSPPEPVVRIPTSPQHSSPDRGRKNQKARPVTKPLVHPITPSGSSPSKFHRPL
jgi:hypothetical protein